MKIEDIEIIQESLNGVKLKYIHLKELNTMIEKFKEHKQLSLSFGGRYLSMQGLDTYEFIGKEIIELLESKKTTIEKEIHNFTLDQLLPKEDSLLGIKFTLKDVKMDTDDGVYYYKENNNGTVIISWYENGNIGENATSYSKARCDEYFKKGSWILV